jgi:mRNA-degrading endonuclease RelE of RelBE toxin-antitoxin system
VKIRLKETFKKDYRKLPASLQTLADGKIEMLSDNPRHPSLRVKKKDGGPQKHLGSQRHYEISYHF